MTREEFLRILWIRYNVTEESLIEVGIVIELCNCGAVDCPGWRLIYGGAIGA